MKTIKNKLKSLILILILMIPMASNAIKLNINKSDFLPHQWKFLTSEKNIKALVCGYGAGKTYAFILQTVIYHLTARNENNKSNGWIIYPTYGLADELFLYPPNGKGFLDYLNYYRIPYNYNQQKHRIDTEYGRIAIYQLQQPKRIVGAELTFIGFDEFDVESVKNCDMAFTKAVARLRGNDDCKLYIVTTPEGYKVTYDKFIKENNGEKDLIQAKTTDNKHLPVSYIEILKQNYDKLLLDQYLNGQFVNLNGHSAYYSFDREKHVIPPVEKPDISETLHFGFDFNVNPFCVSVSYINQHGELITFDEFYIKNSNTYDACNRINEIYGNYDSIAYPDMTGIKRTTSSVGKSDIAILVDNGFRIEGSRNTTQKDRLNTVNNALSKGKCFITENCKHLIEDLERVITDEKGQIDKSDIKLTHVSDAWGYNVQRLFPVIGKASYSGYAAQKRKELG